MADAAFSGLLCAEAALARAEKASVKATEALGVEDQTGVEYPDLQFMSFLC
jgi:hypothetical protein